MRRCTQSCEILCSRRTHNISQTWVVKSRQLHCRIARSRELHLWMRTFVLMMILQQLTQGLPNRKNIFLTTIIWLVLSCFSQPFGIRVDPKYLKSGTGTSSDDDGMIKIDIYFIGFLYIYDDKIYILYIFVSFRF